MSPFHVYLYGPHRGPIPVSFEDAAERLQQLPKLGFEWDGSFVWVPPQSQGSGGDGKGKEQVYGMLYDAAGLLQYCEIQGQCSHSTWQTLCGAILGSNALPSLEIMRLPESQWQDFQSFERLTW